MKKIMFEGSKEGGGGDEKANETQFEFQSNLLRNS